MAAEIMRSELQILRIENETAFAVENGAPALEDVRAIDPVFTRTQQVHRRRHRQQRLTMHPNVNLGRKGGQLTFGHELVGATTPLTAAATPTDDTLGLLFKTCLGNRYTTGAGSDVVAAPAPTTTTFSVTPGHGARFRAGTAILVAGTGTGGVNEVGVIKSISTDAITLEFPLTNAPATGADIWNSYSYYIDYTQRPTIQAQMVGEAVADRWLGLGITGKLSFADLLQLSEVAQVKFDLGITTWDEDIVAAGLVAGSYDEAYPVGTGDEMEIVFMDENAGTRSLVGMTSLEIDPNVTWTPHYGRGAGDKEHVARIDMTGGAAVGSGPLIKCAVDIDDEFRADYEAKTIKSFLLAAGRTAGACWAIIVPRAQVIEYPKRGDAAGMVSYELALEAHENDAGADSTGTAASTALMRSPIVICRM
jgi:hypothetical protein